MRLGCEVKDRINLVLVQCSENVAAVGNVAKEKFEVLTICQAFEIVHGCAIVHLVEAYDPVRIGIFECKMSDEPRSTGFVSRSSSCVGTDNAWRFIHEARSTCDHDVFDIGQRLEFGRPCENGRLFPATLIKAIEAAGRSCTPLVLSFQTKMLESSSRLTNGRHPVTAVEWIVEYDGIDGGGLT